MLESAPKSSIVADLDLLVSKRAPIRRIAPVERIRLEGFNNAANHRDVGTNTLPSKPEFLNPVRRRNAVVIHHCQVLSASLRQPGVESVTVASVRFEVDKSNARSSCNFSRRIG
jgi:hypothetical protein